VGIGTTSPTAKLTIDNGSAAGGSLLKSSSTSYTAHFISNTSTGNAGIYMDAINGDFSGNDYCFIGQNNAGHMEYTINPSSPKPVHSFNQSVGIGTTSPTAKLQIHTATNAGNPEVAAFLVNKSTTINTEVRLAFAAHTNDIISTDRYSYISAKNTTGSNGQDLVFATNATGASAAPKLTISSDYLIKRPAYGGSGLYSKIKLVSGGSGNITHNIFREFKDSTNWTSGGVLVKVLSRSYNTSHFDYAEFLCRYGAYGGSTTAVDVKVAPHSSSNIPTPAYSSQSTLSGNTVYRDVSIVTGYYRVLVIEIVTSIGQVYTSTAGGNGTIYYY
jgi:hypothetical protein